jgi:hypothetical protein
MHLRQATDKPPEDELISFWADDQIAMPRRAGA